jgi:hypothetical protein
MLQTAAAAPVVSLFARCAYCPQSTSFRCLNCQTAICPDCCPSDYCPDCQPAPVAPLMGWSMVNEGNGADDATFSAVTCATCGDAFQSEDPDDDLCAACADPALAAELRAMVPAPIRRRCSMCAGILAERDDTRCAVCQRFMDALDARHAAWKEVRIAA